jgi:hypothetical protein
VSDGVYLAGDVQHFAALSAAPAGGATVLDTGNIAAGVYDIEYNLAALDAAAAGKGLLLYHRNAADDADVKLLAACSAGSSVDGVVRRVTLAEGEELRVVSGGQAASANSQYAARLTLRRVRA